MSLNYNEINEILKELELSGTFIQEVVQPSYDSLALYTYSPGKAKTVFISLTPGSCRINEVRRKIPKNDKPLRFNEILRSRLKGARITSCRQIDNQRIIEIKTVREGPVYVMPAANEKITVKNKGSQIQDETGTEELALYIRLWSNAANIFLCRDNIILDSFYRRPAKHEITGEEFILPEKKDSSKDREFPVRTFSQFDSGERKISFNEKVDLYYTQEAQSSSLTALLEQAEKWYTAKKSRLENALEHLIQKQDSFRNASQWKHQGDLILSYSYLIDGKSNYLECNDYETGKNIRIRIDPKKSAQENAAQFYETYKKESGGLENLTHDIELSKKTIAELDRIYESIKNEQNPVRLEQFLRKAQKPRQQEKKTSPGLSYDINGWHILVGRDAAENDELLRHYAKGLDMWMHTRDYAGGYVFIKNRPGKSIPLEILLYAGNLAVYYSKARKNRKADLYYTNVKYLRRAKNGPKGLVLPTNEKNIHIELDDSRLRFLDDLNHGDI